MPSSRQNDSAKVEKTAKELVDAVTKSKDPANALWELWDGFFKLFVHFSTSYAPFVNLVQAVRAQSPIQPTNVPARSDAKLNLSSHIQEDGKLNWSKLPQFDWGWRNVHDILQQWRA